MLAAAFAAALPPPEDAAGALEVFSLLLAIPFLLRSEISNVQSHQGQKGNYNNIAAAIKMDGSVKRRVGKPHSSGGGGGQPAHGGWLLRKGAVGRYGEGVLGLGHGPHGSSVDSLP